MKERPILFSGPMVRAIIEGRKTQTRRAVGLPTMTESRTPGYDLTFRGQAPVRSIAQQQRHPSGCWQDMRRDDFMALCPYGSSGDALWVRETWQTSDFYDHTPPSRLPQSAPIRHVVDEDILRDLRPGEEWGRCRPSIFMRRWACRMVLPVTSVRLERLQDISEADAIAEGVHAWMEANEAAAKPYYTNNGRKLAAYPVTAFSRLWDSINGEPRKRTDGSQGPDISWKANPWVFVVTFEVPR